MRRIVTLCILICAASVCLVPAQQPAAKPTPFTLSVDSIMRGPKLVGSAPSGIRWAPDSSKIYFSWQKSGEERSQNYSVNADGSDLRLLTPEELRQEATSGPTGTADAGGRRLLTAEGGDIVIYDTATKARRLLTRTAGNESNPRWARRDTAVTFMRDGNLYILSLDGAADSPAEVQLTDVAAPAGEQPAQTAGARGAVMGQRGGGQGARGGSNQTGRGSGDQELTESQRLLRQQEQNLIEYIQRQAEQR